MRAIFRTQWRTSLFVIGAAVASWHCGQPTRPAPASPVSAPSVAVETPPPVAPSPPPAVAAPPKPLDSNPAEGTITVTTSDGLSAEMKIVSSVNTGTAYKGNFYGDPDNKDVWWNDVHWIIPHAPTTIGAAMPGTTRSVCVQKVVAAQPRCGTDTWDRACVKAAKKLCSGKAEKAYRDAAYGNSICGNDAEGKPRQAIFIGGEWDANFGTAGAGGKTKDAASGAVTVACRGVGAVAKCIDFGYKPWVSPDMDELHQACVRMVRADFCGDGTTWTKDGNLIDIEDAYGIQTGHPNSFIFEATWSKNGATFLNANLSHRSPVWGDHAINPIYGLTFPEYQKTHPYCQPRRVTTMTPAVPPIPNTYSLPDSMVNKARKDLLLRTKRQLECPATSPTCKLGL
jgi:hypothetical protein